MGNKIEIFKTNNSETEIRVQFDEDTVWLNIEQLSLLFERDRTVINRHLNNIFKGGELEKKVVCAFFAHTTQHGAIKDKQQKRNVEFYNLDVIISVGYRVNSKRVVLFLSA